jgi:hypothetical protein
MVNNSVNQSHIHACSQCGSELIFLSQETVKLEGARYQQVNSVYKCSSPKCQERKDKEKADRAELRQKQIEAAEKRGQERKKQELKV